MIVFTITSHSYDIIRKDCIASQQAYCDRFWYTYYHIHLPSSLTPDSTARSKLHFLRYFLSKDHALTARCWNEFSMTEEWEREMLKRVQHDRKDGLLPSSQWLNTEQPSQWCSTEQHRVMYIDADCEVQQTCPAIDSIYQSDKYLFVAPGFSGRINSGVIIWRSSLESLALISLAIDNRKTPLPDSDTVGRIYGGGENGHIIHYRKNSPYVQLIDQKWNNNHTPALQDYIRHYSAGWPMRALYTMDVKAKYAWYKLLCSTYLRKIAIKLWILSSHTTIVQPDLDDVVADRVKKNKKK